MKWRYKINKNIAWPKKPLSAKNKLKIFNKRFKLLRKYKRESVAHQFMSLQVISEQRLRSQTPRTERSQLPTTGEQLNNTPPSGTIGLSMSLETQLFTRLQSILTQQLIIWLTILQEDRSLLSKTWAN